MDLFLFESMLAPLRSARHIFQGELIAISARLASMRLDGKLLEKFNERRVPIRPNTLASDQGDPFRFADRIALIFIRP